MTAVDDLDPGLEQWDDTDDPEVMARIERSRRRTDTPLADLYNARRFVDQHGSTVHYAPQLARWLTWDGRRWAEDLEGQAMLLAKATADSFADDVVAAADDTERKRLFAHWRSTCQANRLRAMLDLAQSEPGVPVLVDQLDSDPFALNAANGTIDLRTGRLRPHNRHDLLTKIVATAYNPDATAPRWAEFLDEVFAGDAELVAFVQRLIGYASTGSADEHILPIAYGNGANGKSTFLGVVADILGDHAAVAPKGFLTLHRHEQHPTGLSDLRGRRFVVSYELEERSRLDEGLVKQLTGGDRIRARRMRADHFEFAPTHTLALATNHKPHIRGADEGIWRRLRLVPFAVTIPEHRRDPNLRQRLLADEGPGILRWMVEGAVAWHEHGLGEAAAVETATNAYRNESDHLGQFFEACCRVDRDDRRLRASSAELLAAYESWCRAGGEEPMSATSFSRALTARGFGDKRTKTTRLRIGIALTDSGQQVLA